MSIAITRILGRLKEKGGLRSEDIANIVALFPDKVSSWSNNEAFPSLKAQRLIAALDYTVERLSDFYAPDEIRLWLFAKHQMLKGERAIDLIRGGRTEEVLAIIEAVETGTCA